MKKLAVTVLSLFLALSPSRAKTSAEVTDSAYRKHSVLKTPMRTKSVVARAVPRAQKRLLANTDMTDNDDGPPGTDELDLHHGHRRPEPVEDFESDELSDYVQVRLALARARAMARYREIHA